METSQQGKEDLEGYEGKKYKAYKDSAGIWTNGVGHTGPDVHAGQVVDEAQVMAWLTQDLKEAEDAVNRLVKVPLTQGQFDALVSFTFNEGEGHLEQSTLLRKLNAGDYEGAHAEFQHWVYAGGTIQPGLVKRRHGEAERFEE
jgi:lysozyme